jgi:hypothetical protein
MCAFGNIPEPSGQVHGIIFVRTTRELHEKNLVHVFFCTHTLTNFLPHAPQQPPSMTVAKACLGYTDYKLSLAVSIK